MRRFLLKLSRRRTLERELEAELAFHREMAEAGGNSIPLGNALRIKEASGDPWRFTLLESLWRDVVYGVRGLCRSPMLVLIAVLAVALGIGSTTAVFSLVNAVLLKPVPVPDPDSLVELQPAATPSKFAAWREQTGVLQDVAAYMPGSVNYAGTNHIGDDTVEQVQSMLMSAGALHCWGIRILRGRAFTQQEDTPGGPRVALLGEGFWQRRFAGDPQVLGKAISLNGEAHTVIGIAADSPFLLEQDGLPDVYVPFQLDLNSTDQALRFRVTARLKSGVTLQQANAGLQVSADAYRTKFPGGLGPREGFSAQSYRDYLIGGNRPLFMVLSGAVGLVLLIACSNVANLLLVRAEGRRREIAIRAAIGAGRARVIRQLLTESLLLALAGGALGTLVGYAGIRALLAIDTARLPRVGDGGVAVGLDWRVLAFALGISLLTGIVFGLFPAIAGSRVNLAAMQVSGPRHNKTRAVLVVSEITLAVILLVGSALLIRTFVTLYSVDRGFDATNVLTMRMKMTGSRFQDAKFQKAAVVVDTIRDGLERLRALPGVESGTASYFIPLQTAIAVNVRIGTQPEEVLAGWAPVAAGYFDVFRIPVKRGRAFNDRDDSAALPVVIISESMAKAYWGGADPLGDRIVIGRGRPQFRGEPARQIIGVAGDVRDRQLYQRPVPAMYVPQAQITDAMNAFLVRIQPVAWMVRARDQPRPSIPVILEQLRQATGLPVSEIRSMDQVVSASTARQRFNMLLMSVFGSAALLLAAIGVYGLMAYSVEQRTREIGIRLALGAEASRVRQRVVFEGMRLALAGVVIGIGAAWELSRFLASFLYGVPARDPTVFITVPTVLSVVALLAVWVPAARASRIDPLKALRYE